MYLAQKKLYRPLLVFSNDSKYLSRSAKGPHGDWTGSYFGSHCTGSAKIAHTLLEKNFSRFSLHVGSLDHSGSLISNALWHQSQGCSDIAKRHSVLTPTKQNQNQTNTFFNKRLKRKHFILTWQSCCTLQPDIWNMENPSKDSTRKLMRASSSKVFSYLAGAATGATGATVSARQASSMTGSHSVNS